jgi:ABC-2 type transport system ATP-binding protein
MYSSVEAATVEAIGLAHGYGAGLVSDVDFSLGTGVFGLLGPRGAGKTTLLRTLATVVPPLGGELRICGRSVRSMADARIARRQIGYLPQQFGYLPALTVYEFVRYRAWLREVPAADAHEQTLRAMAAANLTDSAQTKLRLLPGCMVRLCGIAQALVGSPRVVLLDEPTLGLDPDQRLEFRDLVRSLTDATVVLATSRIADVASTCDEVMVMDGGRLLFRGTPRALGRSRCYALLSY